MSEKIKMTIEYLKKAKDCSENVIVQVDNKLFPHKSENGIITIYLSSLISRILNTMEIKE